MSLEGIFVRRARLSELVDLRHRVLRQGLPRSEAIFSGDDASTSSHFGAFTGDAAVCCATFHLNEWQNEPAWQLRAMAVDPAFRGKGLGRSVLELAEMTVTADRQILQLWCNARLPAVPFYHAMGWSIVSGKFEIPTAGPHVQMVKRRAASDCKPEPL